MKMIKGFENYFINKNGEVFKNGKEISYGHNGKLWYCRLSKSNKRYTKYIHKLVYENFKGTVTKGNIVIFIDGDTDNLNPKNLKQVPKHDMFKVKEYNLDENKKWKKIPYYSDYKISNFGDIFSIKSGKTLNPTQDKEGYMKIKLTNKGERKSYSIHRLVYEAFNGKIEEDMVIDHVDMDKSNNQLINLRKVTKSINCKNKIVNKTPSKIYQYNENMKLIKKWKSLRILINITHYKRNIITNSIKTGKEAYGYKWKSNDYVYGSTKKYNPIMNYNYDVSDYRINKYGKIINSDNKIIKPSVINGYHIVSLITKTKKRIPAKVHRLVACTYIDNPEQKAHVHHKDNNRINNSYKNLEWVNHIENITYTCGKSIIMIDKISGDILMTFKSINDACRHIDKPYGSNIKNACNGKLLSAYGYKWEFGKN